MKISFLIFVVYPLFVYSQKHLEFGAIKGKDISGCKDSVCGSICNSKNQLEINLFDHEAPSLHYQGIRLIFNGSIWNAIKYEGSYDQDKIDSSVLKPETSFDSIFLALKYNNIFTLPDQGELKDVKGMVDDGDEYSVSFKAGNLFRCYEFYNPRIYIRYNSNIPELTNYLNIEDILFNQLVKD